MVNGCVRGRGWSVCGCLRGKGWIVRWLVVREKQGSQWMHGQWMFERKGLQCEIVCGCVAAMDAWLVGVKEEGVAVGKYMVRN